MPIEIDSVIELIAGILGAAVLAYGTGRLHQWYRLGLDRDFAFQEGYRHGYRAIFVLVSRDRRSAASRPDRPDGEVS